jgi:ribosomal protein L16 Arg81 hydroxylase
MAIIDGWLADTSLADFLQSHYQRAPFVRPGTAADAVPLLDWPAVGRLVEARPDMLLVRDGRLRRESEPATFAEARALFRAGFSIVMRACEEHDDGLRRLADDFESAFQGEVTIQVYATPGGHHSFGWHYDCEDVFIAQTAGTKDYRLRQNTVNPEPTIDAMPQDMHYERETSAAVACTLIAGDWLYIPRGFWHVALASEDALSISIGVLSPAARGSRPPRRRNLARAAV